MSVRRGPLQLTCIVWAILIIDMARALKSRSVAFKTVQSSSGNLSNPFPCAMEHLDLKYGAARVYHNGSLCEEVQLSSQENLAYENDFTYLLKTHSIETMSPLSRIHSSHTQFSLPGLLENNNALGLWLNIHQPFGILNISLVDAAGVDAVMKIAIFGNHNPPYAEISHTEGNITVSPFNVTCPYSYANKTLVIEFEVKQNGMVEVIVEDAPWFIFETMNRLPPEDVRLVRVNTGQADEIYLEKFVFKVGNDQKD